MVFSEKENRLAEMKRRIKYTKELLEPIVKESKSYADVIRSLGFKKWSGGRHRYIKDKIIEYNLDISHFTGQGWNKGGKARNRLTPKEALCVGNTRKEIVRRCLLEIGRKYECEICKINEWLGKPLNLHIHHIDGNSRNNKRENLQFICPNCHSQTESYSMPK